MNALHQIFVEFLLILLTLCLNGTEALILSFLLLIFDLIGFI